jgi:hypothetical protein
MFKALQMAGAVRGGCDVRARESRVSREWWPSAADPYALLQLMLMLVQIATRAICSLA